MYTLLKGIAAAPGIGMGKAAAMGQRPEQRQIDAAALVSLTPQAAEEELLRYGLAAEVAARELEELAEQTRERMGAEEAEIFETHLLLFGDEEFDGGIRRRIRGERKPAALAVEETASEVAALLESLDDEYLRGRAADIRDVAARLLRHLAGEGGSESAAVLRGAEEQAAGKESEPAAGPPVLLAADLSPSDTAQLDKSAAAGFATAAGGRTSHSAIMARSLGIPAVVGLGPALLAAMADARYVIVDGDAGVLHINPGDALIGEYERRQREAEERARSYGRLFASETRSQDGRRVELAANIGSARDARAAAAAGAEGIGLFRTEFLYMDREALPSEDEQFAAYREAVEAFNAKRQPVVIRTLDIGGDKKLPYLPLPQEENPFLGHRAIRLCLDQTDLFRTQLRAILRASAYGNVKILFPMIAALSEWRRAKALLDATKEELAREGLPFNAETETGIMIEIPAAALMADRFAKEVDFFSIGTNDLVQYTMAADRMNERLAYLTDPFYPAVLRLIDRVIRAARAEGKWTGMCGEMAGHPLALPILLGLGLQEFSMSAPSILPARSWLARLDSRECEALAAEALELEEPDEVRALVEARFPFLADR